MWPKAFQVFLTRESMTMRFYRGEDSCFWRKSLKASTSLQINWISQVER